MEKKVGRPKNCGRCNKIKTQCKCGRPTVLTPEVIQKLEEAYAIDSTDLEACLYAGIGKSTLYNYQEANPEFVDRKALLKKSLTLKSKINISKSINKGDINDSKWYVERRAKDEFSLREERTGKDGAPIQYDISDMTPEQLASAYQDILRNNEDAE